MKKHANVPVFIPHIGCPNDCVFCNQRTISGHGIFDRTRVRDELNAAFATLRRDIPAQIAYFGGSFTGIDREDMVYLLRLANEYIDRGLCESIRISTRPDYINEEILEILKSHRVAAIELGVQSMDDRVLAMCRRGHTAKDTEHAFSLIRAYDFELVGQMMTGLPEATGESEVMTAEKICEMGADGARIYPTVVFEGTALHAMAEKGLYRPMTTEKAVSRTAEVLSVFLTHDVPVIRIGLQSGETLTKETYGYHPAMGEMVRSRCFLSAVKKALDGRDCAGKMLFLRVNPADLSAFIGQKGENRRILIEIYACSGVKISPDIHITKNQFTFDLTDHLHK